MESCWSNQLWSGLGPPGTSLRDTEWTSLILLLLDSEALKMAERACRNVEECLVSDPCSVSPFPIDRLISRQVVPWTSTWDTIRKIRNSWEFLFFMTWMVGIERLIDGIMDFYRRRNKAVFLFLCLVRQVLKFIYRGAMSIVRPGLFFFFFDQHLTFIHYQSRIFQILCWGHIWLNSLKSHVDIWTSQNEFEFWKLLYKLDVCLVL